MMLTILFSPFQELLIFTFSLGIYFLLKAAIKRRKYSKLIPTRNKRFIDILGDLSIWPSAKFYDTTGLTRTAVLLQYLCGFVQLFKNKPLFSTWIGYVPFIFPLTPEAVEEAISGTKTNQKAWIYDLAHCWFGTGLATSHGQKWKSRRKLLTPAFHFEILKEFLPVFNETSMLFVQLLEKETSKEYTSIVHPITLCSLDIQCQTTLGVDIDCQKKTESQYLKAVANVSDGIIRRIDSFLSWFDFTFFLTYGRELKKDLKILHDFTKSVIQERKKSMLIGSNNDHQKKRKALLDLLLQHHIETKDLTDDDIREEVDTFTFAGHDAVSVTLCWALYFIGLYKDVQTKIQDDIDQIFGDDKERHVTSKDLGDLKYLGCVLKESLRICPTIPIMARRADGNMKICGYPIPKDATIVIMPYMMHRREEIYPNPEVFDPSRFMAENSANRHPYAYIPFSAGSRNCIAQKFGLMAVKVVVVNLLRNYTLESLDPRDKVLAAEEILLRPMNDLRIKIRPRV